MTAKNSQRHMSIHPTSTGAFFRVVFALRFVPRFFALTWGGFAGSGSSANGSAS